MADQQKVSRADVDKFKTAAGLDIRLTQAVNIYPNTVIVTRFATDEHGDPVIENGEAKTVQETHAIEDIAGDASA